MKRVRRIALSLFAASGIVATTAVGAAAATPAGATSAAQVSTSCSSRVEEEWIGSTFRYRVVASCSSIAPNTEVRGVLDVPLYFDEQTDWFSTAGRTYVSDWTPAPFAGPSSRIETRSV